MGIRLSYKRCRKQDRGQGQRNGANQHLARAFHDPTGKTRLVTAPATARSARHDHQPVNLIFTPLALQHRQPVPSQRFRLYMSRSGEARRRAQNGAFCWRRKGHAARCSSAGTICLTMGSTERSPTGERGLRQYRSLPLTSQIDKRPPVTCRRACLSPKREPRRSV